MLAKPQPQHQDIKLQQQIQRIFSCVVLHQRLPSKALDKCKQLMMITLKQVASEALNRSICRDGTSTQLEVKDLLAVVSARGDIYKFKIVRALLMNKDRAQISERPDRDVKVMKGAEFEDKEIEDDQ